MLTASERIAWDFEMWKIYRVLSVPPPERIWSLKSGHVVQAGDYGWSAPSLSSSGASGEVVSLEGLGDDYKLVWMADFLPSEVEYAAVKPDLKNGGGPYPNVYAVQKPKA